MVIMNGVLRHRGFRGMGWLAALLFSAVSVQANPIAVGSGSIFTFSTIFTIIIAILVEAVCIILLLHHSRTPRLFLLWIMGMHLLTYPIFIGIVWLSVGLRPELAVGFGEGMIVLIEGGLIYYLCRLAPSAKTALPSPTVGKVLLASLLGNICSVVAFPLLTFLNAWIANVFHSSGID
jgi:hypothetical protein